MPSSRHGGANTAGPYHSPGGGQCLFVQKRTSFETPFSQSCVDACPQALVLSATVMAASLGAFFLYVAVVPIVTVSASVMALVLSFALGAYVGRESMQADDADQPARACGDEDGQPLPAPEPFTEEEHPESNGKQRVDEVTQAGLQQLLRCD